MEIEFPNLTKEKATGEVVRKKNILQFVLSNADLPIFLLDSKNRLVFFNRGCEELTGWSAAEIEGFSCIYTSEPTSKDAKALANSLCPPPQAREGTFQSVPQYLLHRDGRSFARMLNYFPVKDETGTHSGILGIISEIAEPVSSGSPSPAQLLHAELAAIRIHLRRKYRIDSIVTQCPSMKRVLAQIRLATNSMSSLCIVGESGTGKRHLARVVHHEGFTQQKAFVPVECAKLPSYELKQVCKRLFESVREVDTKDATTVGLLPGTVFLEDVHDFKRDMQELFVEQFRDETISHQIRLTVSTDRPLSKLLEDEILLEEFYYLMSSLTIELPPLKDRFDDLDLLAQAFVENNNADREKQIGGCSERVLKAFREYQWPGNLDELADVIAECVESCEGSTVEMTDLPFRLKSGLDAQTVEPHRDSKFEKLEPLLSRIEKDHLQQALDRVKYNKSKAAELLGMTRAKLYRRMEQLEIPFER